MDEITFERFVGQEGLRALRDAWLHLASSLPERRFFDRVEWYESYLDHLDPDPSSVHFVLARRGRQPAAVFPLKRGTARVGGLSVAAWELPHHSHFPFADFIAERTPATIQVVNRLFEYLRGDARAWHVMRLRNLLEGSVAHYAVTRGLACPALALKAGACDYLPCGPGAQLAARVSKNFKGNLRKARNKLALLPGVEYVSARSLPELRQCFGEFLQVEASGWKGTDGTSTAIQLDARVRGFYESLLEAYGASGSCEINLLRAGGQCLAGQFCLITPDARHVLKIGYDEQYAKMAPGNLLMEKLFERCAQEATVSSVNLVTDAEWHVNWNPEAHATFDTFIFNTSPLGHTAHWLLSAKLFARQVYADYGKPAGARAASLGAFVRPA